MSRLHEDDELGLFPGSSLDTEKAREPFDHPHTGRTIWFCPTCGHDLTTRIGVWKKAEPDYYVCDACGRKTSPLTIATTTELWPTCGLCGRSLLPTGNAALVCCTQQHHYRDIAMARAAWWRWRQRPKER